MALSGRARLRLRLIETTNNCGGGQSDRLPGTERVATHRPPPNVVDLDLRRRSPAHVSVWLTALLTQPEDRGLRGRGISSEDNRGGETS